jgi:hypothetical protein
MKTRRAVVAVACVLGALGVVAGGFIAYAGGPPDNAKYVGSNKCMACHAAQHKTWQRTKHAKAFALLQGDEVKNADCVKCHVTGFGKPGGFTSVEATPALENVGCEVCHGPGNAHMEAALNAPESGTWDKKIIKTPQSCTQCHNPHIDQKEVAEKYRAEHKK